MREKLIEEQKAYDLTVDNHARAMARVAELEWEVAALAQSERVPEWIPVGERLPDHGEPVNVWCSGSDQAGVAWVRQGAWYMPEPQALGYDSITHWMPLPAAPSPSKQGGV